MQGRLLSARCNNLSIVTLLKLVPDIELSEGGPRAAVTVPNRIGRRCTFALENSKQGFKLYTYFKERLTLCFMMELNIKRGNPRSPIDILQTEPLEEN